MNKISKRIRTGIIYGALFFGAYAAGQTIFAIMLVVILAYILRFEWLQLCSSQKIYFLSELFYPTLPMTILIYLNKLYYSTSPLVPLYPFLIAWTYDTCAYTVGMLIGKHKMCPRISPGKSWEGFAGGFFGVLALNIALFLFKPALVRNGLGSTIPTLALQSICLTIVAFFGDIFISYLKRKAALKDTGSILPGHGGLLDRFDSVFFVAIAVAVRLVLL